MFQNYAVRIKSLNKLNIFKSFYATEAVLKSEQAKLYRLNVGPAVEVKFTKDEALRLFRQMTTIRRFEAALAKLYKTKLIRGFCHLYSGQEAICCGIKHRISEKDTTITAYRCHGWTYVMGVTPLGVMAELLGRESGCARGKGGSMHLYVDNFYGGNGIVGAHVPLGTGLAFKHKYSNDGGVSVICYGDGASNQGQVFEAFNEAKLLNLPAIYVIENNHYGMGTAASRSSGSTEYYKRGHYIPGILVDGMDIVAVVAGTTFAKEHIKEGNGPILIEMNTYRYFGHSMSDPDTSYRKREEIKNVRDTRDPIKMFRKKIVEAQLATAEELKKIETEVKKAVDDAEEKSKKDKEVPLVELTSDVYSLNLQGQIRGILHDTPGEHKRLGAAVNFK